MRIVTENPRRKITMNKYTLYRIGLVFSAPLLLILLFLRYYICAGLMCFCIGIVNIVFGVPFYFYFFLIGSSLILYVNGKFSLLIILSLVLVVTAIFDAVQIGRLLKGYKTSGKKFEYSDFLTLMKNGELTAVILRKLGTGFRKQ
ncbi:MAG: hypothetical protein WC476_06070 [Phycisphaerae bacterium]|jgi:hypothetical protein